MMRPDSFAAGFGDSCWTVGEGVVAVMEKEEEMIGDGIHSWVLVVEVQ